ncbi:MAG: metal-sensitive transcriptional regulator [Chloroflexi bacterium]|nr:metal-sensitive transcriptional regulator [Chloroflexota bacterium]MCL5107675.1 metal-sensitive transcriptional regulator [Chloroflexota bacterium]
MSDISPSRDAVQRLRRIEGQIKGIQKMIEEKRPCEDVMTQMMAARAALDQVAKQVVVLHIDECLTSLPPDRARTAVGRAIDLLSRIPPQPANNGD